jgi:hypothetical protein
MHFGLLHKRLVEHIRARVRSGEVTERSLARLTGVSQPHLHNVLKGQRFLSADMADQVLRHLHICTFDLLQQEDWPANIRPRDGTGGRVVAVLKGGLGPGAAFPRESSWERLAILQPELERIGDPALVRLRADPLMTPLFRAGMLALLDRAEPGRQEPQPGGYYAVEVAGEGLVRMLHRSGDLLYVQASFMCRPRHRWGPAIPLRSRIGIFWMW